MMEFDEFCKYALSSNKDSKSFKLDISKHACEKIIKKIGIDLSIYRFIIKQSAIRHIRNRHPEDIEYLPRILPTINQCDDVQKSIIKDKQTRQNVINIVFIKKFDDGIMQLVAMRIYKEKVLSLKTFFRK